MSADPERERLLATRVWESDLIGLAVVDRTGRVVEANDALSRLASAPLEGRPVAELIAPAQRDAAAAFLSAAGTRWTSLRLGLAPDQRGVPSDYLVSVARCTETLLVLAEPLIQEVETVNERLLELNDELVRVERGLRRSSGELTEQNQRLREVDRLKDEFVSLISHEFRTPLTSMHGYVELLREDEDGLTAKQREFLRVLDRNARRLLRLVDDLLFVAQLDAGKLRLAPERVEPAALVRECVETIRPLADTKGVELEVDAPAGAALNADRVRLVQLLDNLLTNGIKFTPGGGRVHVSVRDAAERVVVEVADTGIGIAATDRDQIFERFFRTDRATRRAIPGSGLGLAVVKAIVDAHGGTIAVTGAPGAGTTFRVELPVPNTLSPDAAVTPPAVDSGSRSRGRSRPGRRPADRASGAGS
jgi:signal transduction histidine kinase